MIRPSPQRGDLGWQSALGRVAIASAIVLAGLTTAVAARWHLLLHVDEQVGGWAYRTTRGSADAEALWMTASTIGQPNVLRGTLLLLSLVLALRRVWAPSAALALTVVVEGVAAPATKFVLNRDRPSWPHPLATEPTTSYPSGHAAAAGMFAVAVVLLALYALRARPVQLAVGLAAVTGGAIVVASRVFLGVHYLSDVVAGLLFGALITIVCWLVAFRLVCGRPSDTG